MRQLQFDDVFTMSRILKKLNINLNPEAENDAEIGLEFIKSVAENLHLAQKDVNDFLGDLSGIPGEAFGKLPVKESLKIIKEFKELDGIADFFDLAGLSTRYK